MGTPDFAVPTLQALIQHYNVVGVVTQPDKPVGRKGVLTAPPVKQVAQAHGIPVLQPAKLRAASAVEALRAWQPELIVVAAFGQILPKSVLDMPKFQCINVHGSLLPRWRGAAPIHAALKHGDRETGITIMLMDVGLDTGAMLSKRAIPITSADTTATLHDALAQMGADLLIDTLPDWLNGRITPEAQDDALATYAPQLSKDDGRINWHDSAEAIERTVRAYDPFPTTFTLWEGKTLKIWRGRVGNASLPVGQVGLVDGALAIGTGEGVFFPLEVQLEGKKRVPVADFLNGYPHVLGANLAE
jgi:methionyl-tRNA formyltransferase